jgi:hypothetical protein
VRARVNQLRFFCANGYLLITCFCNSKLCVITIVHEIENGSSSDLISRFATNRRRRRVNFSIMVQ